MNQSSPNRNRRLQRHRAGAPLPLSRRFVGGNSGQQFSHGALLLWPIDVEVSTRTVSCNAFRSSCYSCIEWQLQQRPASCWHGVGHEVMGRGKRPTFTFPCFNQQVEHFLTVSGRCFVARTVRSIAGKLRQRDDKDLIVIRPLDEHTISGCHVDLSALPMIWRTSFS